MSFFCRTQPNFRAAGLQSVRGMPVKIFFTPRLCRCKGKSWPLPASIISKTQNGHAQSPKMRMAVNSGKQIRRSGEPHCQLAASTGNHKGFKKCRRQVSPCCGPRAYRPFCTHTHLTVERFTPKSTPFHNAGHAPRKTVPKHFHAW